MFFIQTPVDFACQNGKKLSKNAQKLSLFGPKTRKWELLAKRGPKKTKTVQISLSKEEFNTQL